MLRRPQFIPIPIPPHKSISPIWKNPKSHIWGLWGPHQTHEFTQNKFNRATVPLTWFLMLKIMLQQPQFVSLTYYSHKSVSPISRDPKSRILVPIVPNLSPELTQNTPNTALFPSIVLDGWNHFAAATICNYTNPCSKVYIIQLRRVWITHLGPLEPLSEPRNNPEYPWHSFILPYIVLDG